MDVCKLGDCMSTYWEDIEEFNKNEHERLMEYIILKHRCKMEQLKAEVELYKLKHNKYEYVEEDEEDDL